jgi:hypothetical protein
LEVKYVEVDDRRVDMPLDVDVPVDVDVVVGGVSQ